MNSTINGKAEHTNRNSCRFIIDNPGDYALGVEIDNGRCLHLADKYMPLPISVSRYFSPIEEGQNHIEIHIVQGMSSYVSDNRSLSRFVINDLSSVKNTSSLFKISFQINRQGLFRVCVKNTGSGYGKKMIICRNPFSVRNYTYMELYKLKNKAEETLLLAAGLEKHLKRSFLNEIKEISENVDQAVKNSNFSLFSELYVLLDVIYCELKTMAELKAGINA